MAGRAEDDAMPGNRDIRLAFVICAEELLGVDEVGFLGPVPRALVYPSSLAHK